MVNLVDPNLPNLSFARKKNPEGFTISLFLSFVEYQCTCMFLYKMVGFWHRIVCGKMDKLSRILNEIIFKLDIINVISQNCCCMGKIY